MMDNYSQVVSEEIFAAWLDGTMSQEEEAAFQKICALDTDLQEILDANDQVDEDYEYMVEVGYDLPYELQTDFEIPQITFYDEEELSSYGDDESYSQEDLSEDEELGGQEEDAIDYLNDNPLEDYGLEELI